MRDPDRGLQIGHLKIEAQMRINIFMIVAMGQLPKTPAEAFAAGVVFAGIAVAIASPVAERFQRPF